MVWKRLQRFSSGFVLNTFAMLRLSHFEPFYFQIMPAGISNTVLNKCRATLCRSLGTKTITALWQDRVIHTWKTPSPLMEPMSGTAAIRKYLSFITKIKLISFGSSSEETPPQTNEVQQTQASSLTHAFCGWCSISPYPLSNQRM